MSRTADSLKIHALNDDPSIIPPILEGVTPGNKLTVHAQLVSPEPDFNGKIRLDPGELPGDYILKLVEVRSSPAD
jgi:hypothetical protein